MNPDPAFTMSHDPDASAAGRIRPLVQGLLAKHGIAGAPGLTDDLRAAGLTSLDVVNLMLAVEGEFDVFVPTDRMTPEQFRTIARIAGLVSALLADETPAQA